MSPKVQKDFVESTSGLLNNEMPVMTTKMKYGYVCFSPFMPVGFFESIKISTT